MEVVSNYALYNGEEITVSLGTVEENGNCLFQVICEFKYLDDSPKKYKETFDSFESALLNFYHNCYQARQTVEHQDNTNNKKGKKRDIKSVKPRTMQEIADFFGCYVAKDWDDSVYAYNTKPYLDSKYFDPCRWCINGGEGSFFKIPNSFVEDEDVDWHVLYKGNK